LYELVETCEYGMLKEEMLRDRIVVGIRDHKLSERLQMDTNLTLEKAKQAVRQKEAVVEHGRQLQGSGNSKRDPIKPARTGADVKENTKEGLGNP
jgi:hypothetical protein